MLKDPDNPHGKAMLRPDGQAPSPGQIMTNPNLAKTFRALSEGGKAAFYTGRIAESVVRCVRDHGGVMTEEDMGSNSHNEKEY